MSTASKLNRHLRGWRRGMAKPAPVNRCTLRQPKPVATPFTNRDLQEAVRSYKEFVYRDANATHVYGVGYVDRKGRRL